VRVRVRVSESEGEGEGVPVSEDEDAVEGVGCVSAVWEGRAKESVGRLDAGNIGASPFPTPSTLSFCFIGGLIDATGSVGRSS
jgi:hypothetical protein